MLFDSRTVYLGASRDKYEQYCKALDSEKISNIFIQAEILPVDWISYSRSEIVQTQHCKHNTQRRK